MKLYQRIGLALLTSSAIILAVLFCCWMDGYNFDQRNARVGYITCLTEIWSFAGGLMVFLATK